VIDLLLRDAKAVLFDLDGTLQDSSKAITDAVETVLKSRGLVCDRTKVAEMIGMPLEKIFTILAPNLSTREVWQLVREYREYYMAHHLETTSIHPAARMFLTKLRARGYKLGIVTGKYKEPVIDCLDYFGISELFDTVVTSYEVKKHKPAPDIVMEAAKRLGVGPEECIVVGDSPFDVEAGNRAGSFTIAVISKTYTRKQLENAKPTLIVEELGEIGDLIR
jgi:pyrophosphatase PpaX